MRQHRYTCHACGREWLDPKNAAGADPWQLADGCRGCGSAEVELVAYTPAFPGADIPRDAAAEPAPMPTPHEPPAIVQPPPHALISEEPEERNWAVELSGANG